MFGNYHLKKKINLDSTSNIGLAQKFIQVYIPAHGKPKRNFWPTQ